jgi:hypothetical protein
VFRVTLFTEDSFVINGNDWVELHGDGGGGQGAGVDSAQGRFELAKALTDMLGVQRRRRDRLRRRE